MIYRTKEENKIKGGCLKPTIFILSIIVLIIFIFRMNGYTFRGLIMGYKAQKEQEHLRHGGSISEANKSIEKYNNKVVELNEIKGKFVRKNPEILVYTNDNEFIYAVPRPNIIYSYRENMVYDPVIQKNEKKIEAIDNFIKNKDSLGFFINLKRYRFSINVATPIQPNEEQKYIIYTFHTNKETDITEEESITFTEKRLDNKLFRIEYPDLDSANFTYKFYLTAYNNQLKEEEFKRVIKKFSTIFLKNKKTKDCFIRKVKLRRN